ncbi:hypothetical protein, partial [Geminicoccus harenae]|uniref:hypothetical protein n=1 Tax=Geminicoccus harenae TaxID=2498453 RepID=UPI001C946726
ASRPDRQDRITAARPRPGFRGSLLGVEPRIRQEQWIERWPPIENMEDHYKNLVDSMEMPEFWDLDDLDIDFQRGI